MGQTRDLLSDGVLGGLGSERSYIKQEKVQEAIDRNRAILVAQAAS